MEGHESYTKTPDQGEAEPPQSRVSNFSVTKEATNLNPNSHRDYAGFHQQKQHSDFHDTGCFLNQQMTKIEERQKELSPLGAENINIMGFMGQEWDKQEERDAELCQHELEENDNKSGFFCQEMSEPEECHAELPQLAGQENGEEKSTVLSQQMAQPEKYIEVGQCKREDGDQKTDFVGTIIDKPEECVFRLPQHIQEQSFKGQEVTKHEVCGTNFSNLLREENGKKEEFKATRRIQGKYFYYDAPLSEETGVWIPVSVPPLSTSEHEEWARGLNPNGGYFPEGDLGWGQNSEEEKELTMWDVVVEMLLAARGKVGAFASGDIHKISWISSHLIDQAWKEIAETLTEANCSNVMEILGTEPPKWLPDSVAFSCMLCSIRFHPILCTRHHCRFCGGIFCRECTRGRSLLPAKFHVADPQRVCDVCCVRLESIQPYLMEEVSRAAQLPIHDVTDLSSLRSWLNFPWGQSMEHEIYKAANTIRGYNEKVGSVRPEKAIPDAVLRQAKGLAILTVVKVGMMVTYKIGTGLVIARREDGTWSPPSAITSFGVGWGAQAGGELIDFIIVLRTNDAIKMFGGDVHISIGAGLGAAVGILGRTVEADVRAGDGGYAACYTYSCSKGAFVGCSLEGSIVTTRMVENSRFYGSHSINASEILLGSSPQPPAASILYRALGDLYQKLQK